MLNRRSADGSYGEDNILFERFPKPLVKPKQNSWIMHSTYCTRNSVTPTTTILFSKLFPKYFWCNGTVTCAVLCERHPVKKRGKLRYRNDVEITKSISIRRRFDIAAVTGNGRYTQRDKRHSHSAPRGIRSRTSASFLPGYAVTHIECSAAHRTALHCAGHCVHLAQGSEEQSHRL